MPSTHPLKLLIRRIPPALLLLWLTFGGLVLLHSWTTPLFEAPDEAQHYAYVRWLAEGHGLPSMADNSSGASQEVAQPPFYYAVAALFSAPFSDEDFSALEWHNPNFGYQAPGTLPDNKNMLVHTEREGWPWQGAVLAIRAARFTSLLFGLLAVAAAWGLGYEAFGHRQGARLTAALVAFHPQFVMICGVVSNDSAAAALAAAALWIAARTLRRGLTPHRALAAGVTTGLTLLTKTSPLPLIAWIGLALLAAGWRNSAAPSHREALRRSLLPLALYSAAALLVGGSWYARNFLLYGDPLGMSNHLQTLWGRPTPVSLGALLPEFPTLIRSFWAAYGWGHILWPDGIYWILSLAGLLALLRGGYRLLRGLLNPPFPLAAAGTLAAVWLGTIVALLLQWMRQVEAPHGRLLFPALSAWALLLAVGLLPHPSRPKLPPLTRGFLLGLALLATLAPGARILATFAPPRFYEPTALPGSIPPRDLTYGDSIRMVGLQVAPQRLTPGDTLSVTACWEALRPIEKDYFVFAHLIGPENRIIASRHTYPGLGRLPTPLWIPGRAFCDTYRMVVDPQAEAPLRYRLEIGLFIPDTPERLSARTSDGTPVDPPVVAAVDVAPAAAAPTPAPAHPLQAQLGSAITLEGADWDPGYPGTPLTVTLYWDVQGQPEPDLIAFVHLWRPGDPQPLAQHDGPPHEGWYPTAAWRPGDRIVDRHRLVLPADLPPGRYPLWAGFYRPADGTRLPAAGPAGPYPDAMVPLGEIEVLP